METLEICQNNDLYIFRTVAVSMGKKYRPKKLDDYITKQHFKYRIDIF